MNIRKVAKYAGYVLGSLLLLVFVLLVALQFPSVQTRIAHIATSWLSGKLGTTVQIDRVSIRFLDHVRAKGIYIEDLDKDTLLYAGQLDVDINLLKILSNEVNLEEIGLKDAFIHLKQDQDSIFSYQFILDAFASEDTTTQPSSMVIRVGTVQLDNIRAKADLLIGQNELALGSLRLKVKDMDLDSLSFHVRKLEVDQLNLTARLAEQPVKEAIQEVADTLISPVNFPLKDLGLSVQVDGLSILNSNVRYQYVNVENGQYFDPEYIYAEDINIEIDDIAVNEQLATLDIKRLETRLNDRIRLQSLKGKLTLDEQKAQITGLELLTDASRGRASLEVAYPDFARLMELSPEVRTGLVVDSLYLAMPEVIYFVPSLDTISSLQSLKKETLFLHVALDGSLSEIAVDHLSFAAGRTNLKARGTVKDVLDMNRLALNQVNIEAHSDIRELRNFLPAGTLKPGAERLGKIDLATTLDGSLAQLYVRNLRLKTQGRLQASLQGQLYNVLETDRLGYNLQIRPFATGYSDIALLVDSLPEMIRTLENVAYNGTIKGTLYDFDVDGVLSSSVGDIIADLRAKFNKDYSYAKYNGTVTARDIDLKKLLANDSLGLVNLTVEADGAGMTLDDLDAQIRLHVADAAYNSYTYRDLDLQGRFSGKQFDGQIAMNDPNVRFDFEGLVNLNDSVPVMNFKAALDTLDLYATHLLSFPLRVRMEMDADLTGSSVDDILGNLNIRNLQLANDSATWSADSIIFKAEVLENKDRNLELESPVVRMQLSGNYQVANLPKIFMNFGDQYFPFSSLIGGPEPDDAVSPGETAEIRNDKIDVYVLIQDPTDLAKMLQIDLQKLDSAHLSFTLDAPQNLSNLEFLIPAVQYGSYYAENIRLTGDNQGNQLKADFSVDSIRLSETMTIPLIRMDASMSERRAKINARIIEDSVNYRLGFSAEIDGAGEDILLSLQNPLYLNFQEWNITQSEPLNLKGFGKLPEFTMSSGEQRLSVSGDTTQLSLAFNAFDINNLLQLVKFDSTTFKGAINGKVDLGISGEEAPIIGDLKVTDIRVNDNEVGDLSLLADKKGNNLDAQLRLVGGENELQADADYNLESSAINADVNIRNIAVAPFEPFLSAYAQNLSGAIRGNIKVSGTTETPQVNGQLILDRLSARVNELGTQYTIQDGKIAISESTIEPNIVLTDSLQRKAYFDGRINHKNFQDMSFDLRLRSDAFTFLDSEKKTDALFYGKLIAKVNAEIKGNLDLPKINVKATTLEKTDVTVQLISPQASLEQESYIVFVNDLDNYSEQQVDSIAQARYKISSVMDLTINADITENAIVRVVIDPITGDNLEIRGNAQLLVKIPETGDMSITGVYTVKQGNYRFSYQNLLKKNFEIVPGSKVTFTGNAMNAIMDIKARYNTQASTLPLLQNDISSLSDSEKESVRKRANVGVVLDISGRLSEPQMHFDIEVPDNSSGPVGSSVTQALEQLRMNESDLNKEVFSLLLFNSFTGSSSTGNIATTGTSTALRSVGDLINTQLNRLAGKAEGLEINFDLDQYEDQVSEGGGNITEVNLGVSQSLFDDRLVITVGGNVDVGSGNEDRQGLSSVAGDFVLEYKVTEDGKYRVKVFQKSDYDALNENNLWKTGVGFSYQTKFGRVIRKRKMKDQVQTEQPTEQP